MPAGVLSCSGCQRSTFDLLLLVLAVTVQIAFCMKALAICCQYATASQVLLCIPCVGVEVARTMLLYIRLQLHVLIVLCG